MQDKEIVTHLEYLEGVLLAQSLVLMALIKHQPAALVKLKANVEVIVFQLEHVPMTPEKNRGLTNTLDKFIGKGPSSTEIE